MQPGSIVILDFGGQYAHLIARRVREFGAYSEIAPPHTSASLLKEAAGIILSGGPQSVYEEGSPQGDPAIFELGIPVLGLCYGHQWLAHALGGKVESGKTKEYGPVDLQVIGGGGTVFDGLPASFPVWMSHGDEVTELPEGFVRTASTDACRHAAMADEARRFYGLQFHVEVTHTRHGEEMLRRFVDLCAAAPWSVEGYAKRVGDQVLAEVGDRKVFMLVSGGVDSTVAFTLLNSVLGPERVQGLLVDTGLMRKDEVRLIEEAFAPLGVQNLRVVDASEEFFAALDGITDPEAKRKAIGDTFLAVQKRVSEAMGLTADGGWMLGQGTIYPDTIETGGTAHADHIKTHHNRVEAIQAMIEKGLVIEPLKELYKDEVRRLGEELGLPHALVWRHPFPGPGLGVRILCATGPDLDVGYADAAEKKTVEEFLAANAGRVLPVRSVGVQGDGRTYRHAVAFFTGESPAKAAWARAQARSIPNRIRAFSRVLLCCSHADPADLVVTPGGITPERADLLREADAVVHEEMARAGLYEKVWQFPVVLLPAGLRPGGQSVVLRPITSTDAMTAEAAVLPEDVCSRMAKRILALGIDCVFYDLTSKPPGTIEWE